MLLVFSDISLVTFILFNLTGVLTLYLILNTKSVALNKSLSTITQPYSLTKIKSNELTFRISIVSILFTILYLLILSTNNQLVWFNHLLVTNTNLSLTIIFNILLLVLFSGFVYKLPILKNLHFEYFFAIIFLNILLPIIFFSTNLLTFFFILEVISSLILFKFITGRDWEILISTKKSQFFNYKNNLKSTAFTNIVFFQYWVSFFSSVLIVYSLLIFLYFYGSTEWVIINFLTSIDMTTKSISYNSQIILAYSALILGLFLKLGIAPVHLYKIELYKGLPFITLLFYTVYFFFIFFLFFCFLIITYLNSASIIWYNIGILLLSTGVIWVMCLLFDITGLKAFFAYSTIVNSMAFFALIISML